jgi:hypothetical protein
MKDNKGLSKVQWYKAVLFSGFKPAQFSLGFTLLYMLPFVMKLTPPGHGNLQFGYTSITDKQTKRHNGKTFFLRLFFKLEDLSFF